MVKITKLKSRSIVMDVLFAVAIGLAFAAGMFFYLSRI